MDKLIKLRDKLNDIIESGKKNRTTQFDIIKSLIYDDYRFHEEEYDKLFFNLQQYMKRTKALERNKTTSEMFDFSMETLKGLDELITKDILENGDITCTMNECMNFIFLLTYTRVNINDRLLPLVKRICNKLQPVSEKHITLEMINADTMIKPVYKMNEFILKYKGE